MTWKFVTMCPLLSHTKPDPVPLGTCSTAMLMVLRLRPTLVMLTTEPLLDANSLMVEISSVLRSRAEISSAAAARG